MPKNDKEVDLLNDPLKTAAELGFQALQRFVSGYPNRFGEEKIKDASKGLTTAEIDRIIGK